MAVTRLNFSVPEFTQTIWVSPEARLIWESRIRDISNAWIKFERLAVVQELKPLTLQSCHPEDLPALMRFCSEVQLYLMPLKVEGSSKTYGNAAKPYVDGQPWTYRVIIGAEGDVLAFVEAWDNSDDKAIGEALGFPPCCVEFFHKNWVVDGWRDLTYPMVRDAVGEATHYQIGGAEACNILLRWLGVRMVSHLPCNFNCESTARLGNALMSSFSDAYPNEYNWLKQMLEWPVRWDSLHGIAIISTPILKIVTSTDPLSERVIVDRAGMIYPAEGASGVVFPFKVIAPIRFYKQELETNYSDNGFSSRAAMDQSHKLILDAIEGLDDPAVIVDLGCGNAALLEKIGRIYPLAQLIGVEIDPERYNRAKARLKNGKILFANIKNLIPLVSGHLIIISVNRLSEMGERLKNELFSTCDAKYILVYNYGSDGIAIETPGYTAQKHAFDGFMSEAYLFEKVTPNEQQLLSKVK